MNEINDELLRYFADKDHPLANIEAEAQDLPTAVTESLMHSRIAHHLLDLAQIPRGTGDSSDLDSRVYLATARLSQCAMRLYQIATWHRRESGDSGLVGEYCVECAQHWPCATYKVATTGGSRMDSPFGGPQ